MEVEEVEKSRMTTTTMVELDEKRQTAATTSSLNRSTKTSSPKVTGVAMSPSVPVAMDDQRERRPRVRSSERRCLGRIQSRSEGEDGWQFVDQVDNVDETLHATLEANLENGVNKRLKPVESEADCRIGNNLEGNHMEGNNLEGNHHESQEDHFHQEEMSEGSEVGEGEGSVVSSVTDKYGFLAGDVLMLETPVDVEIMRRREVKWLEMLTQWDAYMLRNYRKVRERCRKGIPPSIRARAWLHLCGAKYQMENAENRQTFRRLWSSSRCEQRWLDDIEKDLHRNFPTHELFGGTYERIGQEELFRVLKAYSVLNPVEGYCQAQAPIAALLLMNMPAEDAFWCLTAICDKYIPGYYSPGMEAIQLDGDILFGLLKKTSPAIHKHLKDQDIVPILYMQEWFLCIFARTLPWPSVLRVWDMFCCEGVKVLFRVALVLIKHALPRKIRRRCPSMYETLEVLKHLPAHIVREEFLIPQVLRLDVTEEDMEREHRKQLKRRKAAQAEQVGSR